MTALTILSPLSAPSGSTNPLVFLSELAKPSDSTHPITFLSPINAPSAGPAPSVSIDISALPESLTVGTPVSFGVTATNEDGATGAITISAASLPPGLSISATTGSGPYTATISGTPTTEASAADFAISASNGAQSSSGNWRVGITAAASGSATRVAQQMKVGTSGVTSQSFDATDVQAGDLIIVKYGCQWGVIINNVTDTAGNTYSAVAQDAAHSNEQQLFYAIAGSAKAGNVVKNTYSGNIDTFVTTLEVYRAPAGTSWSLASGQVKLATDSGQNPDPTSTPPITQAGNGVLAIWCGDNRGQPISAYSVSPGTVVNFGTSQGGNACFSAEYFFSGGLSSQVVSGGLGGNTPPGGGEWAIKTVIAAPFIFA